MQIPKILLLSSLLCAAAACTHGPTHPDWIGKPPETLESREGARTYTCRKRPTSVSAANSMLGHAGREVPVYDCR